MVCLRPLFGWHNGKQNANGGDPGALSLRGGLAYTAQERERERERMHVCVQLSHVFNETERQDSNIQNRRDLIPLLEVHRSAGWSSYTLGSYSAASELTGSIMSEILTLESKSGSGQYVQNINKPTTQQQNRKRDENLRNMTASIQNRTCRSLSNITCSMLIGHNASNSERHRNPGDQECV